MKLKKQCALFGHQEDAQATDLGILIDTTEGNYGHVVAVIPPGSSEPIVLPAYAGGELSHTSGDWHYTPAPEVYTGGCIFCGGDIREPVKIRTGKFAALCDLRQAAAATVGTLAEAAQAAYDDMDLSVVYYGNGRPEKLNSEDAE